MSMKQNEERESDLPIELSMPARRALVGAGYTRLEQLTRLSKDDIKHLHGVGPKTIVQLRHALGVHGLSFADEKKEQKSPS